MGDRNSGPGRNRAQRRDARNDLERDPGFCQDERFLAAAAEHERIAALEPDDVEAAPPVQHEQSVDLVLVEALAADADRVRRRLLDELVAHQPVVDEDVAGAHELEPPGGDQAGIARAGSDEEDRQGSDSSTTVSK